MYFARLRLRNNGHATGDSDTYKSKLRVLEEKKINLLQKLLNIDTSDAAAADATRNAANAAANADPNNDDFINNEIGNAGNIFNPNEDNFAATPPDQNTAYYMSNISTALNEFRKILVDFKGLLQTDLNRASGVILPGTNGGFTQADINAARAEGKAEAEREEADKDAAEEAAAEKEEKDDKITAAEVGAVVGVVGVVGYFAANALGFLE